MTNLAPHLPSVDLQSQQRSARPTKVFCVLASVALAFGCGNNPDGTNMTTVPAPTAPVSPSGLGSVGVAPGNTAGVSPVAAVQPVDSNGNPLPADTTSNAVTPVAVDTTGVNPSNISPTGTAGVAPVTSDPNNPAVSPTAGVAPDPSNTSVTPDPSVSPVDPATVDPTAAPPADATGLDINGICLPVCSGADADDDADGCGFENETDCVTLDAEIALGATECTPNGGPPAAGDGFMMGCECVRTCDNADTDPDDDGVTDGWGWEYGATCVVAEGDAVVDKLPCVPPAMSEGDGYLLNNEDGSQKCVPACEHPEWVEDADGWGFEYQDSCIVEGSNAEGQVARCTLMERAQPFEPGDGFMVETDGENVCVPPCSPDADDGDEVDDGWGYEQDRACIFPDSKASIKGLPCVPPPAEVTGTCPAALECPVVDGRTLNCGCTWQDGYAERKSEIMAAVQANGGDDYFLASAMMETDNLRADYPYGDVYPDGRSKTGDAFNAGITKQNWGMMRQCHSAWNGLGSGDYNTGAAINDDLTLDVTVYTECRAMYGGNWWSGHRNGANNLGQDSADIRIFKGAMDWTYSMLQEGDGHFDDDVYFWVDVTAI